MGKTTGRPNRPNKSLIVQDLIKSLELPPGSLDIVTIKPSQIRGDFSYQRKPTDRLATLRVIADNFDLLRVGVIHVVKREDGYYAIDGLGRCYVMAELLKIDNPILCIVHKHIKGVEEEAVWFVKLNPKEQRKVNPKDIFRAAVRSGDKHATHLKKTAEAGGLVVNGSGAKSISVQSAEFLDELQLLKTVSDIKCRAWPKTKAGNPLLNAIGAVVFSTPGIDLNRLVKVLSVNKPKVIEADTVEEYGHWPHARIGANKMALYIVGKYNEKLAAKNRINPSWHELNGMCEPGTESYNRWKPLRVGVLNND